MLQGVIASFPVATIPAMLSLAALLVAVDAGPGCGEVPREVVALVAVPPTAALEVDVPELLGDADVGLELRDLQRRRVAPGVTEAHDHHVRIGDRSAVEDLVNEGCCAACINESVAAAFQQTNANLTEHRREGEEVFH